MKANSSHALGAQRISQAQENVLEIMHACVRFCLTLVTSVFVCQVSVAWERVRSGCSSARARGTRTGEGRMSVRNGMAAQGEARGACADVGRCCARPYHFAKTRVIRYALRSDTVGARSFCDCVCGCLRPVAA